MQTKRLVREWPSFPRTPLPTLHCTAPGMGQGLRALPAPAPPGPFPGPLSEPGIGVSLLGAAHVSVGEEGKTPQK